MKKINNIIKKLNLTNHFQMQRILINNYKNFKMRKIIIKRFLNKLYLIANNYKRN